MRRIGGKLTFSRGGIHPPGHKNLVNRSKYFVIPNPTELLIHFNQHIGPASKPIVNAKDEVIALQKIGEPSGYVSVTVHTPLAGTVKSITHHNLLGIQGDAALIAVHADQPAFIGIDHNLPEPDLKNLSAADIMAKIQAAGLVGMGGATFPTHVKLSPPPDCKVDTVIINGAECEPYLTADDCLMQNHPEQVVYGLLLMLKVLGAEKGIIALEDNKPEAAEAMQTVVSRFHKLSVVVTNTIYPQGSEKQLVDTVLGRTIPLGKLPANVGVILQNAATSAALYEAVQFNRPLVRRIVTVSGGAVKEPKNVLAPVGVSAKVLLEFCGGLKDELATIVFGGPMMGRATNHIDTPVTKGTSGILFLTQKEIAHYIERDCLRCGSCAQVCPMGLVPSEVMNHMKFGMYDKIEDALACVECGTCVYVCPSHKRLTQWCRLAKYELRRQAARKAKVKV